VPPKSPNYRQARGDRDRAKASKKQEKLRKREEETAKRKGVRDDTADQPTAGERGSA
jgi:hypothetical protein